MNYHELITAIQQYLKSGFKVSREHGQGFLKSLEKAIGDPTIRSGQLGDLIALKPKLSALMTPPEPSWPGSTSTTG
jgi:hypothetical protein